MSVEKFITEARELTEQTHVSVLNQFQKAALAYSKYLGHLAPASELAKSTLADLLGVMSAAPKVKDWADKNSAGGYHPKDWGL